MKKTISLNGQWAMGWCPVGKGTPESLRQYPSLPYQVPGDVHTPLIDAGLIAEPLYGMNSLDCRWVEDREFWCERSFRLEREDMAPKMLLTFEGLDCTADIWLNGAYVGSHNNAFVEVTFDVAQLLTSGENRLLVRIDQGLKEAQKHDLEQMGTMWNNEQPWRAWMRKPQYVYGWDWNIWLASCGIWKSVTLTAVPHGAITDVYVRSLGTPAEGKPCKVAVEAECLLTDAREASLRCTLYDREGVPVAQHQGAPGTMTLTIPQAHLWWCNEMGDSYLYTAEIMLESAGKILDRKKQRFGLKTVALEEPLLHDGTTGFTFLLNGERIFCKGANHVPCDALPGRITAEKERQLVELARDSHMNMLRIWGGGTYASEELMDTCDEMGILVWHDFLFACGYHPDHDPGFMENVTDEARKGILRLRRHPSLIGWAGNNEIQEMYLCQKQWNKDLPWYGGTIYEKLLPSLVKELCPDLIYRESSPFGGEYQADGRKGDQHIWILTHVQSHPHYLDLWRFPEFQVKFLSEFGIMGAMTLETAESCIPAEHMHPTDPVWLHHTNSCQNHTLLDRMKRQYFGDGELSPQQYILRSQAIQSEITRHLYEAFRCQKFYCSGLLFWTLSDSYGVHNWSMIDYGMRRKPIYYALKEAMAPLALRIEGWDVQNDEGQLCWREHWQDAPGSLRLWGMNDTLKSENCTLSWTMTDLEGKVLLRGEREVTLPENTAAPLAEVSLEGIEFDPKRTVFRARLWKDGALLNESKYFFAPFREMVPEEAGVRVDLRKAEDGSYEVRLTADKFIWLAHLAEPDGVSYSENDFDLWPGETRTVTVRTVDPNFTPVLTWMGKEA